MDAREAILSRKNQLYDLLERAKVVVAVFDQNQVLSTQQYWEYEELLNLQHEAQLNGNLMYLSNQMRINSDKATVDWIRSLIDEQEVGKIPADSKNYDIQIFDSPELHAAIKAKAQSQDSGISRFDRHLRLGLRRQAQTRRGGLLVRQGR